MREIKFRCYDTKNNIMRYQDNSQFVFGKDYRECNYENGWNTENNGIFMQYVGIKDKNGVEIYENDIVFVTSFKRNLQVIYRQDICAFQLYEDFENRINYFTIDQSEMEVIGHIYQNPELIA